MREETADEMLQLIERRKTTYGKAKMTSALVKVGGSWENYLTRFVVLSSEDAKQYQRTMNYGDLLLKETVVDIPKVESMLQLLSHGNQLTLPGLDARPIDGDLQRYPASPSYYQPSNDPGFNLEWPGNVFVVAPKSNRQVQLPNGPTCAIDEPLYDSGNAAVNDFFGFLASNVPWRGSAIFMLPNYKAKITQIKLGSTRITVTFALGKDSRYSDLLAKMYLESAQGIAQRDFEPKEGENVIPIGIAPHLYVIYLFSKAGGEVVDFRRFGAGWTNLRDVVIETTPDNIEQIISRGENNRVEFKLAIPKKWEDFAETAVSMSNSSGGIIFLGVDDDTTVVGVDDPKIVDTITDALRNLSDPWINPKITTQVVQGKTVAVVEISQGTRKPYVLRARGPMVRIGATDRIATRDEIVALATNQSPWTSAPGVV